MESQSETTQTVSALKLLVLKNGEYDLWSMRMEQYLTFIDHAFWEVIVNGDLVTPFTSASAGVKDNSSSTNETVNTAYSVSATSSKDQASTASYANDVMFSFFTNQYNAPQLDNKDLEQIDIDDLKQMDLKWQVAMLIMRVKRKGHFAREYRAPRNQGNRNRDAPRRNALEDTSTTNALVVQDGIGGYDWSFQAEEGLTNFALMVYTSQGSSSSSSSDSEGKITGPKEIRQVWDNTARVNRQSKLTHPHPKRNFVPAAVLTKSGQVPVNAAKQSYNRAAASVSAARRVNTAASRLNDQGIFDSECSKHMTRNKSYLTDYQEIDGGFVAFGGNVKGDKKHSVLFTETECVVLSPDFKLLDEIQVLLKVPRNNNMYSFDLKNVVPLGGIENQMDHNVKTITCDNGTEFKNRFIKEFCEMEGRKPTLSFMRPFGYPVTILNTLDHLGNQTNGNAGTKANINAGQAVKKTVPGPQYVLLLLLTSDSQGPKSLEDEVADDVGKKNKDTYRNSTYRMFSPVSVVGSSYVNVGGSISVNVSTLPNVDLPTDPIMPNLEDTADLQDTRIFSGAYDDEVEGAMADFNNLEPTTVVYGNKKDERGIVVKNKARLVAQGHTQEEGINYDEVFAPVTWIEAIGLFLAYASFMRFIVYQMDVKSVFLYGTIEEEVYVYQPPGLEDPQFPNKVYKVEKALYGLHQALRAWYKTLSTYLLENIFRREIIDKTLFIQKDKGLQVMQRDDGIFISQDKYVADILKNFDFSSVKTVSTPIETNKALLKDKEAEDVDVHLYRIMIGSLMYLTAFRLDIMFAVCACARFQVTPKVLHLHVMKRIFRYLKDSDYAGASLDRKSTIGGCQFLGKRLILWQCKKQTVVANSTIEADDVFEVKTGSCKVSVARKKLVLLSKINDVKQIHAIVDGKTVVISESSVRSDLHFNNEDVTPLFASMLVPQVVEGESSGQPSEPQPPSSIAPPSHEEQVTTVASQPQKTHTPRRTKRGEDDRVVRASTTATSLEVEQKTGNIDKTRPTATLNEPSPQGTGSGSRPRCQDTTLGDADAQTRFETASKQSYDPPFSEVNTYGSGKDSMEHQDDLTYFVPPTPHDSPLSGGHTPGSDEGVTRDQAGSYGGKRVYSSYSSLKVWEGDKVFVGLAKLVPGLIGTGTVGLEWG
uniref:Reverse transcriptase Ty1/copia-type domain-containing protein n=1 Tax=Tanacetum cinerariifolium TaxID=118510 RepID=A0A6L2KVJ4_TANCI|nr:hypothetical protein [Tanacetum cinerariifolium]